jgi:hypothetical protein
MNKLWLLLMVTPLQLIHAQEVKHAPTVEQCRADQRLWLSNYASTGFAELTSRVAEMRDCEKVDPASADRYHNTGDEILAEQALRLQGFLYRHNLYNKFLAEDAQGR